MGFGLQAVLRPRRTSRGAAVLGRARRSEARAARVGVRRVEWREPAWCVERWRRVSKPSSPDKEGSPVQTCANAFPRRQRCEGGPELARAW
jgi:hypothetical protein